MIRVSVLDPRERRRWRVYERNLVTVQVDDAVRPTGRRGRYYDRDGDAVLVERIRDEFGNLRSGVVPKAVEGEFLDILEETGPKVPRDESGNPRRVLTFGSEKSRNSLAGESVTVWIPATSPSSTGWPSVA